MKRLSDDYKYDIVRDTLPDPEAFSKKGWYYSQAGIAHTPSGWVAVYRRADSHPSLSTDIMVAYSQDGREWSGHHSIAHADVWNELSVWGTPQLSHLRDGRLVIICDIGQRSSGQDFPKLSDWQKQQRGMTNHLFWSDDDGQTWSEPILVDKIGGQPSYIMELASGDLIFTRTRSAKTYKLWRPPQPWGNNYYVSESVRSSNLGSSWEEPVIVSDSPFHGDCEVGLVEIGKDSILALTRIGLGNGAFGQPSRMAYSYDGGRSWSGHQLAPIYGQRPIVRKLDSGKLLVVYRNRMGTPGTYALLFDPYETFKYEPATFIYEEERCQIEEGKMTIKTEDAFTKMVSFQFYPAQAPDSRVEMEMELRVEQANTNGCNVSAGCWVRFLPNRICLADYPEIGFSIDATQWHTYKIIRHNTRINILVDGEIKMDTTIKGLENRLVQVGTRMVKNFAFDKIGEEDEKYLYAASVSHWRSLRVAVDNQEDYDIDWAWDVSQGYPDPFRRDRLVALDIIAAPAGHGGYAGVDQHEDGTIIIADYTVGGNGGPPANMPFIRAYVVDEKILSPDPEEEE